MKLIPTEIHEDGELTKIEYHNEAGEFVIEEIGRASCRERV